MSEQEKKSGINEGTKVSVKMSPSSRHKPHRPAEPQEEPGPDLPRRAKAPAVPSDDFKNVVLSGAARDIVSSEKHIVPKKKSSPCKRRGSTPEDVIAMASLTVKKDTSLPQPIPAQIPDHIEKFREEEERESAERADVEKKADDDSIAEEINELRTADAVKEHSEWPSNSTLAKKKEISWVENQSQQSTCLRDSVTKSQAAMLERKASVGPCFKPNTLYGGPSGITICIPKKSVRQMNEECKPIQSVINFNVSKRMLFKTVSHIENTRKKTKPGIKIESEEERHHNFFSVLRIKLDNMTGKVRNMLNM